MKNPPHPGDLIRTELIEALGLTVSKAAEILQVRRATLSDLLHGKAALTPEMALRIEKAFGPDMDHLLRMQLAYDVARTREHARGLAIKRYAPARKPRYEYEEDRRQFPRIVVPRQAAGSAE
ncbi:MAG TPA: HigA family addiction module antitoxin [Candidatus Acidoferrum sp.]|nr:HigA family addiction module antitoxin [Candidatus Acidoferrum sp.]